MYKKSLRGEGEPGDGFAEAISAAERADVVIMSLGLDGTIEGEETEISNEAM